MFILWSILACTSESEVGTESEPVPEITESPAPESEAKVNIEAPQEEPQQPAEPEAPPPEPVMLNTLDANTQLPIYRHKDSGCYVLVPTGQSGGSLNPIYQRIPTACPDVMQWESWDNCREGELWQIGDQCECRVLVGQPKPAPVPLDCPKAPETPDVEEGAPDTEAQ